MLNFVFAVFNRFDTHFNFRSCFKAMSKCIRDLFTDVYNYVNLNHFIHKPFLIIKYSFSLFCQFDILLLFYSSE